MGSWGFCLASLLSLKGYKLHCWTTKEDLAKKLESTREHPQFPGKIARGDMHFTTDLLEVVQDADLIIESVTTAGFRPVLEKLQGIYPKNTPFIITSKGIEQKSTLTLPEVALSILGEHFRPFIGYVAGPGFAKEIIQGLPTSVVGSSFDPNLLKIVCETFNSMTFRVYPNSDIIGVALGGALKNIVAISCGMLDGLHLGFSARAALMTRGLHEIRKLAVSKGCKAETINGLAGMGDLFLTCSTPMSRNFLFGKLIAEGKSPQEALASIGMAVEGVYTVVSACELSRHQGVAMPITELIFRIIYENLPLKDAFQLLMQRAVKEEHL